MTHFQALGLPFVAHGQPQDPKELDADSREFPKPGSSPVSQALVLAGMTAHQVGMRIAQPIVSRERLSYKKLHDLLAE